MTSSSGESLRTPRLVLTPSTLADLDRLHAHWTAPDVRRYLWDDRVIPVATAREAIESSLASFRSHGFGVWVLGETAAPDTLVGFAGLRFVDDSDVVELLYALEPDRWGRGLAREASRAVLAHGFGKVGLPRIVARVDEANLASRRVAEGIGMALEGVWDVAGLATAHYARRRGAE